MRSLSATTGWLIAALAVMGPGPALAQQAAPKPAQAASAPNPFTTPGAPTNAADPFGTGVLPQLRLPPPPKPQASLGTADIDIEVRRAPTPGDYTGPDLSQALTSELTRPVPAAGLNAGDATRSNGIDDCRAGSVCSSVGPGVTLGF